MEKKLIVILLCVIKLMICNTGQADKPMVQIQLNNVGYNIVVRE